MDKECDVISLRTPHPTVTFSVLRHGLHASGSQRVWYNPTSTEHVAILAAIRPRAHEVLLASLNVHCVVELELPPADCQIQVFASFHLWMCVCIMKTTIVQMRCLPLLLACFSPHSNNNLFENSYSLTNRLLETRFRDQEDDGYSHHNPNLAISRASHFLRFAMKRKTFLLLILILFIRFLFYLSLASHARFYYRISIVLKQTACASIQNLNSQEMFFYLFDDKNHTQYNTARKIEEAWRASSLLVFTHSHFHFTCFCIIF